MRRSTERTLVAILLLVTTAYAVAEETSLMTSYASPRGVYDQLRSWGLTVLAEQSGGVGINTTNPKEALQIGDRFTFHSGGHKVIGYNFDFVPGPGDIRLVDDEAAALRFTNEGDIRLQIAASGPAGSLINWTEGVILKNNGNVGIGTLAPAEKLDVDGHVHISAGDFPDILLGNAGCGTNFSGITFAGLPVDCTNYALLGSATDTFINRPAGGTLYFRENNIDQMVIEPGGNVGIGTTNPATRLDIQTDNSGYGLYAENNKPGTAYGVVSYAQGALNTGLIAGAANGSANTALYIPFDKPPNAPNNSALASYSNAWSMLSGELWVKGNLGVGRNLITFTPGDITSFRRAMIFGGTYQTCESGCSIGWCVTGNPLVAANYYEGVGCACPNVSGYTYAVYTMGVFEGPSNESGKERVLYGCYR